MAHPTTGVTRTSRRTLWIGTYPVAGSAAPTGGGEGIWKVTLDQRTGALADARQVAVTPAPSFLAWGTDESLLYATNEEAEGHLSVWRRTSQSLELVGIASTGGAHPCHVFVHGATSTALVANYTSGSLAVIQLDAEGVPTVDSPEQVFAFEGSGPDPERQEAPHAHYVLSDPTGDRILVTDLGADLIHRFRFDPAQRRLTEDGVALRLPSGTGPRHAVFSTDGKRLYVLGELDGRLHTIAWDAPSATGLVTDSDPVEPGARNPTNPAHVVLGPGRLEIGARGGDRILSHHIDDAGKPTFMGGIGLPGAGPRHHAIVDGWLVVAQQRHGGVVALGPGGVVAGTAAIPSPACVLPSSASPTFEAEP